MTALSVDPTGQWLFSGSEDGTMRVWEVATARCAKVRGGGESPLSLVVMVVIVLLNRLLWPVFVEHL